MDAGVRGMTTNRDVGAASKRLSENKRLPERIRRGRLFFKLMA